MIRRSVREVKLTSKFEEFSHARLSSVQRLAHPETQNNSHENNEAAVESAPAKVEKAVTPKVEREAPKTTNEAPRTSEAPTNHGPAKERTPHKALRQKTVALTPATPVYEPTPTPTHYNHMTTPMPKLTANGKIRGRPRKSWPKAETVVKPMSSTREELLRLREENGTLKMQLEAKTVEFEELKRQSSYTGQTVPKMDYDDLKEKYARDLAHAKRREWCVICLNPSRYYCCWNTTYCSQKCQVHDWYQRHNKSCERRRALRTVS